METNNLIKRIARFSGVLYGVLISAGIIMGLFYRAWWFSAVVGLSYVLLILNQRYVKNNNAQIISAYFEDITLRLDSHTKDMIVNFPLPLAILNSEQKVLWYNQRFKELTRSLEHKDVYVDVFLKDIKELSKDFEKLKTGEQKETDEVLNVTINDEKYDVYKNYREDSENAENNMTILYFVNTSRFHELSKQVEDQKTVVCQIVFDNYEEVMSGLDDHRRQLLLSEIDRVLGTYAGENDAILKKLDRDNYFMLLTKRQLSSMIECKFPLLNAVKSIQHHVVPTISMGVGKDGNSLKMNEQFARAAVDMALGRGGDQVVIKDADGLKFFGGHTAEPEKQTRVKARVVALALRELLQNAPQVMIMGHKNSDVDSFGSAIALYRVAKKFCPKSYVVLNSFDHTVENFLKRLEGNVNYQNVFVNGVKAEELILSKTLLIVVDTHIKEYMDCPSLLNITSSVVIIDHHRRSEKFLENTSLLYHEPYASSTAEMVIEVIGYMDAVKYLLPFDSEALYAGIVTDTKNFTFKTGVRTFEAAASLRRIGLNTISVKRLFQYDLDDYIKKTDIVKAALVYKNRIAISICEEPIGHIFVAQAADELLNLVGVTASFVLAVSGKDTIISGRSLGDINVQLILEKLGGGGHMSMAGAKLEGLYPYRARQELIIAIDQVLEASS